jgi:hypothetical protein
MVLGIKVTNVTTGFHKFFQCRLLVDKIRLAEENPAATTVGTPCFAFESWALGKAIQSNRNRPIAKPRVFASKMSIARSTCARSSSDVNIHLDFSLHGKKVVLP